jgi:high mobility group protein B3
MTNNTQKILSLNNHINTFLKDTSPELVSLWNNADNQTSIGAIIGGKVIKGKKEKVVKTGGAKRSKSAYILFCIDARIKIKQDNPGVKATDVMKTMGSMWTALSDSEKQPFVDLALKQKAELDTSTDTKKSVVVVEAVLVAEPVEKTKKAKTKKEVVPEVVAVSVPEVATVEEVFDKKSKKKKTTV